MNLIDDKEDVAIFSLIFSGIAVMSIAGIVSGTTPPTFYILVAVSFVVALARFKWQEYEEEKNRESTVQTV